MRQSTGSGSNGVNIMTCIYQSLMKKLTCSRKKKKRLEKYINFKFKRILLKKIYIKKKYKLYIEIFLKLIYMKCKEMDVVVVLPPWWHICRVRSVSFLCLYDKGTSPFERRMTPRKISASRGPYTC